MTLQKLVEPALRSLERRQLRKLQGLRHDPLLVRGPEPRVALAPEPRGQADLHLHVPDLATGHLLLVDAELGPALETLEVDFPEQRGLLEVGLSGELEDHVLLVSREDAVLASFYGGTSSCRVALI